MPINTTVQVTCDRCQRLIPSGYVWPYSFGPFGPMRFSGNLCADLPNSCKDLIEAVFHHGARVVAPPIDPLD